MEALRNAGGFLGTDASLLADITLIVQILFLIVLIVGIAVQINANRGKPHLYPWHDRLQSAVVLLNLLFIIFVMIPSFGFVASNISGGLSDPVILVPTFHAALGLLAEGLGIYCFLAGFKILPRKIGVLRYWMWAAFVAWTAALVFGIGVYLTWYTGGSESAGVPVAEHDAELIEEVPPTTPVEAIEEHAEEPIAAEPEEEEAELVEEHAEEPVEVVPTATPTLSEPAIEAPAEQEPAEAPAPLGLLTITDGEVHSDQVAIQMTGVTPLDDDTVYEGWLQGQDSPPFSLGILPVTGDSIEYTFIDPENRRLFDFYNGMFITAEPADDSDPAPSGNTLYTGEVAPAAMDHVRHVVTAFPGSPDGDGLALNALAEANLILLQIEAQQQAVADDNLAELLIHAETTLNIIEGSNSPEFGDRDGDGETFNPGDGFGLLAFGESVGYLQGAADHAALAREAAGASDNVALHAGHVEVAAANSIDRANQIRDLELQILQVASAAGAAELVNQTAELAEALLNGVDADGDGQIAPVPGEGGVQTMYEHGQLMGSMEIFPVPGEKAVPATEPTATPELIDEHDEDVAEIIEPEFVGEATQAGWQQLTPANAGPGPRYEHGMQYNAATNQLFLFGGRDGSQDYNDVWALDLDELSWRQLAVDSPVAPRPRHSMVMIVDEPGQNLYVSVGQSGGEVLNDIWRLNLATETWEDLSDAAGTAPAARYGSPGGNLNGNLLLTHGFGNTRYDDTWLFDTDTGQWQNITPAGEVPLRRCLFAATVTDESLVMHGGCASGFGDCFLDDTWLLDTNASAWRQISSEVQPVGRQHQTLVDVPGQNQVILFGGEDASRSARDDVWLLELAAGTWQPVEATAGPEARYNHAAVWLPAMGMLVYGGRAGSNAPLADMWLLAVEGATIETVAPTAEPVPEQTPTPTPTVELISEHDGE